MEQHERNILKSAARIIERGLKGGTGEVKIPGFGKLYLSRVDWTDKNTGNFGTVNTVRFKPFKALKEEVGDKRIKGAATGMTSPFESLPEVTADKPETTMRTAAPVVNIHTAPSG